jgi:hypothetical protein
MIARTLSKLYPAPIALCQHDLIGTIEQITNDLTRLMIADIYPRGSGHQSDSLKPPPAARGLNSRLSLTLPAGIWGSLALISELFKNGSLH